MINLPSPLQKKKRLHLANLDAPSQPWPTHFEGSRLYPAKFSSLLNTLSESALESVAVFQSAGRQVILQNLDLMKSNRCRVKTVFEQAGFIISRLEIENGIWKIYYASRNNIHFHIREQVQETKKAPLSFRSAHLTSAPLTPRIRATIITPLRGEK